MLGCWKAARGERRGGYRSAVPGRVGIEGLRQAGAWRSQARSQGMSAGLAASESVEGQDEQCCSKQSRAQRYGRRCGDGALAFATVLAYTREGR
jgi:hypothetical protein